MPIAHALMIGALLLAIILGPFISRYLKALNYEPDHQACVVIIPREAIHLPADHSRKATQLSHRRLRPLNKILEEEDFYGDLWFQPLIEMRLIHRNDIPSTSLAEVISRVGDERMTMAEAALDHWLTKAVRKHWEFAQGLYAMELLGALTNESVALGIGSGHEDALFYLTRRIQHVTAVDLYHRGGWGNREGNADMLTKPWEFSRLSYPHDHLSVYSMDATALNFPDASFDIVFSFSAIEHFYQFFGGNGIEAGFMSAAAAATREMARVVRPGGVVVIVTEIILNDHPHFDWVGGVWPMRNFFTPADIERYIVHPAVEGRLELVEPINWSISNRTLRHSVPLGRCRDVRPHLVLRAEGVVWTSMSLVFRKKEEA